MYGIYVKLKEIADSLPPSERQVAKYLLENENDSIGLSIVELAKYSGSSQAAITRLCKSLKLSGYRELSAHLIKESANVREETDEYTDICFGDDLKTIIKNVCYNNKKAIDDSLKVIDERQVRKAVNVIFNAKRIDLYGVGASGIIAADGQQKFMRINKFAQAYIDTHLQLTSASTLSPNDIVIAISYSGETKDILDAVRVAKKAGATTIALTKYGKNSLNEECEILLNVSSPEISMRSGAMSSRIAQLNMMDIIFSAVASRCYTEIKGYLNNSKDLVATKKITKNQE